MLKGSEYKITEYYKITMKDIVESAIDTFKDRIYYLNRMIEREKRRSFPCLLDLLKWEEDIDKYQYKLKRLEKKL